MGPDSVFVSKWKDVASARSLPLPSRLPASRICPRPPPRTWPKFKGPSLCIDTVYTSPPSQFPAPLMFRFSILVDEILFQRRFGKCGGTSLTWQDTPIRIVASSSLLLVVSAQSRACPFPMMLDSVPVSLMVILGRRDDFFYFG